MAGIVRGSVGGACINNFTFFMRETRRKVKCVEQSMNGMVLFQTHKQNLKEGGDSGGRAFIRLIRGLFWVVSLTRFSPSLNRILVRPKKRVNSWGNRGGGFFFLVPHTNL